MSTHSRKTFDALFAYTSLLGLRYDGSPYVDVSLHVRTDTADLHNKAVLAWANTVAEPYLKKYGYTRGLLELTALDVQAQRRVERIRKWLNPVRCWVLFPRPHRAY